MIEVNRTDVSSTLQHFYVNFFFIHYDFFKKTRIKIDVFNFAIANILNQQNENEN